ncbi:SAM-dependent methyltransferase [Mycobacterium sp. CBMA271]|uniref:class I SAM-dependent methyltransferase n=1 Tax=unclassified Mycobacteroides TaxID=2618759 RepID=UPI0012DF8E11|nr:MULTISPECIES: SAM-dependent methyltransferase [unclassified Mycobacteroides]MUM18789.1 methyltransferase [Mycobacteroides sp. CBMA 326]MUM22752.1 SAM-dependent methyltransferase [Mycobacteroides sp. CBMA 271]
MKHVSRTSQWTAAARALESERDDPLFVDPLARTLAEPEGFDLLRRYGGGGLQEFVAIRTKYLDDLIEARLIVEPASQVVLIAAGMDTRPYRLQSVVDSTRWFEVDYPALQGEKAQRIGELGVNPRTEIRYVGTDLASDWIPDLVSAGWDASAPTVWIPEALLFFLTPDQAFGLLSTLRRHSAPNSVLGVDILSQTLLTSPATRLFLSLLERDDIAWKFGTDSPEDFVASTGWTNLIVQEPGESGVGEQRWPYQVQPRSLEGVSRNWLVKAAA